MHEIEAHGTALRIHKSGHGIARSGFRQKHPPRVFHEGPAAGIKPQAPAAALKQAGPHFGFDALHAAGQRGLGEPEGVGSRADEAMVGHGDDAAHILQIHAHLACFM
ncbi:hypothetical protein GCM10009604_16350 [Corynebacterium aurimucosum]